MIFVVLAISIGVSAFFSNTIVPVSTCITAAAPAEIAGGSAARAGGQSASMQSKAHKKVCEIDFMKSTTPSKFRAVLIIVRFYGNYDSKSARSLSALAFVHELIDPVDELRRKIDETIHRGRG
ncbi:MAG: hypothetical protein PUB80_00745, partial [Clostridiales bacterium]|nr:hypothetical protein [Clostridiales bacterium]